MNTNNWICVTNSSNVKSIAYDETKQVIYVNFIKNDNIYAWLNCTKEEFNQFINSESKGKFVHHYLEIYKGKGIKIK